MEERKITTGDSLVLGILRLHKRIDGLHSEIVGVHKRIDDTDAQRIEDMNRRIDSNFKWTVSLILGTWASMMAILIPILLKVAV